jgi:hypothetical protein
VPLEVRDQLGLALRKLLAGQRLGQQFLSLDDDDDGLQLALVAGGEQLERGGDKGDVVREEEASAEAREGERRARVLQQLALSPEGVERSGL